MDNFKIGGKITLDDNESYIIVDIVKEDLKTYLFCSTTKKPILPVVLECIEEKGNILVTIVNDAIILNKIARKVLNGSV